MMISDFHNLVRANNPINNKRPNAYVYFKESLAVGLVTSPYLKEYTLLEIFTENRKGCAVSLYRSPSQAQDQFND